MCNILNIKKMTIEEKIEYIKKLMDSLGVSAYRIGLESKVSQSIVSKIVTGKQTNPKHNTLDLIINYLENPPAGTEANYQLSPEKKQALQESQSSYKVPDNFKHLPIDDKLNTIYELVMQNSIELEVVKRATELLTLNAEIKNIVSQKKPENK